MASPEGDPIELSVSQPGRSEPRFIIKHEGRYYVTLAVWPYDPHAEHLSDIQKAIVKIVADLYEQARGARAGEARPVDAAQLEQVLTAGHTHPPHL
jgi:hypothetical protein